MGWDATCCVQIGWAAAAGMAVFCVPSFCPAFPPEVHQSGDAAVRAGLLVST